MIAALAAAFLVMAATIGMSHAERIAYGAAASAVLCRLFRIVAELFYPPAGSSVSMSPAF